MPCNYDVVIIDAGPAGLMAAKVAGENGLSVALLERKHSIADIQRCCATMFAIEDGYYFGERMYFNEVSDSMDHTEFLQLLTSASAGEDAATYLNKLVTETLPCSLNPYNLLKSVNASIMGKIGRIQKERPDICRMLQQAGSLPLKDQMRRFTMTGFPNT